MRFSPAYAIFLRYWYLLLNTPQRLIQVFIWSSFDIILWGFMSQYLGVIGINGFNFTTLLLGALVFWQLIARIQQGVIMVFLEDSWARNFLNIFASPMRVTDYLVGIVASALSTSALAILSGSLIAVWFFGLSMPPLILPFLLYGIILSLFAITIGILSAAIVLRLGPSAEWFAWPIPAIMQPLVGVFYPISVLPGWAQALANVLPPSYVFEGLRTVLSGGALVWSDLGVALLLSVAYLFAAGFLFVRVYWWALRTGAISRFGTESF
jgi:ABC-2 type transport system permease protein